MTLLSGDCRKLLAELETESVQCCVTSPPYWGLRDYGHADQIGQEATPEEYVATMVEVFREVRRVLKSDGTLWLNLGDSYFGSWGNYSGENRGHGSQRSIVNGSQVPNPAYDGKEKMRPPTAGKHPNLKPKDLVGIPWMVAFALRADGWYLRQDIIWAKPNPMPESVTDRCTKSHEYIFLLTKSQRYFYDAAAIAEPSTDPESRRGYNRSTATDSIETSSDAGYDGHRTRIGIQALKQSGKVFDYRNKRSVWTVVTKPYADAHFATFPAALITPCILAGSRLGDVVLDPFGGSGTTGEVAISLGRKAILIELNPDYAKLIEQRTTTTIGLAF